MDTDYSLNNKFHKRMRCRYITGGFTLASGTVMFIYGLSNLPDKIPQANNTSYFVNTSPQQQHADLSAYQNASVQFKVAMIGLGVSFLSFSILMYTCKRVEWVIEQDIIIREKKREATQKAEEDRINAMEMASKAALEEAKQEQAKQEQSKQEQAKQEAAVKANEKHVKFHELKPMRYQFYPPSYMNSVYKPRIHPVT